MFKMYVGKWRVRSLGGGARVPADANDGEEDQKRAQAWESQQPDSQQPAPPGLYWRAHRSNPPSFHSQNRENTHTPHKVCESVK